MSLVDVIPLGINGSALQKMPDPPKEIVIPQSEEAHPTQKQIRLQGVDPFSLPQSFRNNSQKEQTLLEYVENFRRQFTQLFPDRAELLLFPLNECGVRKFVCTSIRPTLLKFPQTYHLQSCASFIADFFQYTALESPLKLPDFLPSSTTVVRMREGDCLDLSSLLTSVLRGSGFQAYVVSGYAPMWVTLQDQSATLCPLEGTAWVDTEDNTVTKGDEDEIPEGRYKLEKRNNHQSKYLEMLDRLEKEEAMKKAEEEASKNSTTYTYVDELEGRRVHCWVLVMAGCRELPEPVFIEPSTGRIYPINDSPYLRIESLWNDINYWVNMQDCLVSEMSFDTNGKGWEFVLIQEPVKTDDDTDHDGLETASVKVDSAVAKLPRLNSFGEEISPEKPKDILLEPPAWPTQIEISHESFDSIYPEGKKVIFYKRCNVEKYSEHYEGMEGLVFKLTFFHDDSRQKIKEIREIFSRRRDFLQKRVTIPEEKTTKLLYAPGKPSGIKELIEVEGKTRLFRFFPGSRVDGLVKRYEIMHKKFVEDYVGCDNRLTRRSVTIDSPESSIRRLKGFSINTGGTGEHPVRKIVEKFDRDPSIEADIDVRKRTNLIGEGTITLDYHFATDRITSSTRTYNKDGSDAIGWQADPLWKMPRPAALRDEFKQLVQAEKELMSQIRSREADFSELISQLRLEMSEVVLDKTIYEKAREKSFEDDKPADGADNERVKSSEEVDYLSPFLAQFPAGKPLSREQAEQARDECMASLTERLLERANIIQRRLNEENETLKKREAAYQRSQGAHSEKDDEEFNEFYEQTMFRIHILDARLHRHEKMAMKKFKELDMRLRADSRLEVIYQQN